MSQNKTVIPESEYDLHQPNYSDISSVSDFYRPSGAIANSTVIAGSDTAPVPPAPATPSDSRPAAPMVPADAQMRAIQVQERVIVGCLFSLSRGLLGEMFPLYLGRNMIGLASTCDITLKEGTVSDEHAVLYVRCDEYPGDCTLSITDYGSSYGTSVNSNDCRYETLPVRDGDVITIGRHYRLLVRLFDAARYGLFEDSDFQELETSDNAAPSGGSQAQDLYAPSRFRENDNRTVIG